MQTSKRALSLEEGRRLKALAARHGWRGAGVPVLAGGAVTYPDNTVTNPLAAPTISGTKVTVDFLLQNPTRVTRQIANLVMQNFFLDKVFMTGGEVTGGAVLYDQIFGATDVYLDRDVERVEPGAEFPVVTGSRKAPLVAQVEKFGGKFAVTDEAKRRNDVNAVGRQMMKLANTITRKMHQRGVAELEAAITAFSREKSVTELGGLAKWKAVAEAEWSKTKRAESPTTPLMGAIKLMEEEELPYNFDTLLTNPTDTFNLRRYYGTDGDLRAALADIGISQHITTPRITANSAILVAGRMVGEMRLEEPMRTVTEREGAPHLREQTWVQSGVNPTFFVTDPLAAIKISAVSE